MSGPVGPSSTLSRWPCCSANGTAGPLAGLPEAKGGPLTVGCVGEPNMGKSSVINRLMGASKVGVGGDHLTSMELEEIKVGVSDAGYFFSLLLQ